MSIDHQSPLITETLSASMVDESEDQSFAEMFAEQEQSESKSSKLAPGQKVTVRIVAITPDTVFVSTGSKVDGIVDREELEVDGALPYQVDDMVELFVVTVSPQEVKLSKIIRGTGGITALEDAYTAGLPVEGKILGQIKGGYSVEVLKRRAFCPTSQIDLHPLNDPESVIGKIFPFVITRLEKSGRNIVLSRRVLLEKEQAENIEKVIETLTINDVIEVVIKRMVPYGVFVEIAPGVEGLVHISELSWTRLGQPDEAFSLGDTIRVKVLSINKSEKGTKFSLSAKAVTEDPWKSLAGRVAEGDVLNGKVVRTVPFGAFVEIFPGVEGLVHLSEFSFEKRVMKAEEMVVVGDHVSVKIKELDSDKKRVSLSIRDVAGDPWNTVSDIFTVDSDFVGTVEKRSQFGLFITLAPGITGLLPSSVIQASKNRKNLERLGLGDSIGVVIKKIDAQQHRISLAPAGEDIAMDNSKEEKNWKEHVTAKKEIKPSVGSLGLALQAALSKKNR